MSSRKPPLHPNHPLPPIGGASLAFGGSRQSIVAPVHSTINHNNNHGHSNSTNTTANNNRLFNNTTFQNNQYTFSLSREGAGGGLSAAGLDFGGGGTYLVSGAGYLDPRPMSSASPYAGPAGRASRGTKSDIGLSSSGRRPSTSTSSSAASGPYQQPGGRSSSRASTRSHHAHAPPHPHPHQQHQQKQTSHQSQPRQHGQQHHSGSRSAMSSGKSEFLLSYLSQSAQMMAAGELPASGDYLEHYKASMAAQTVKTKQPRASTAHHQLAHATASGPLLYLDSAEAAARAMGGAGRHQPPKPQLGVISNVSTTMRTAASSSLRPAAFVSVQSSSAMSASASLMSASTACHRNVLYQQQQHHQRR